MSNPSWIAEQIKKNKEEFDKKKSWEKENIQSEIRLESKEKQSVDTY